jgi:protoheme IX farnesyltransferase
MQGLVELSKPRITQLVVLTAAAGYYLGERGGFRLWPFAATLIGTALVAAGTNAFNMVREREIDARMQRTRNRPLPSGRVSPRAAIVFATVTAAAGIGFLAWQVNLLTAGLAALTLVSYVWFYTSLKPRTSLNTLVGAVPGALPVLGGWTAAGGGLSPPAWAMFWILFLWQLPHFLALAWIYREDYRSAGLAMLSIDDPDGTRTARMALLYAVALVPVSLLPAVYGVTGTAYFVGALVFGLAYVVAAGLMVFHSARRQALAWRVFVVSILYLPALLTLAVLDKVRA